MIKICFTLAQHMNKVLPENVPSMKLFVENNKSFAFTKTVIDKAIAWRNAELTNGIAYPYEDLPESLKLSLNRMHCFCDNDWITHVFKKKANSRSFVSALAYLLHNKPNSYHGFLQYDS